MRPQLERRLFNPPRRRERAPRDLGIESQKRAVCGRFLCGFAFFLTQAGSTAKVPKLLSEIALTGFGASTILVTVTTRARMTGARLVFVKTADGLLAVGIGKQRLCIV